MYGKLEWTKVTISIFLIIRESFDAIFQFSNVQSLAVGEIKHTTCDLCLVPEVDAL